ncbi:hypothetical protein ACLKA7_009397 [Drosophila subpalustris]
METDTGVGAGQVKVSKQRKPNEERTQLISTCAYQTTVLESGESRLKSWSRERDASSMTTDTIAGWAAITYIVWEHDNSDRLSIVGARCVDVNVDVWAMCGKSVTHTAQPTSTNVIHELEHQPTFGLGDIE